MKIDTIMPRVVAAMRLGQPAIVPNRIEGVRAMPGDGSDTLPGLHPPCLRVRASGFIEQRANFIIAGLREIFVP